jgi:hypothetical protein
MSLLSHLRCGVSWFAWPYAWERNRPLHPPDGAISVRTPTGSIGQRPRRSQQPGRSSRLLSVALGPSAEWGARKGIPPSASTLYHAEGFVQNRKAYVLPIQSEAGLVSLAGSAESPVTTGLSVPASPGACTRLQRGVGRPAVAKDHRTPSHVEVSLLTVARLALPPGSPDAGQGSTTVRGGTRHDRTLSAQSLPKRPEGRLIRPTLAWGKSTTYAVLTNVQLVARDRWMTVVTRGGAYRTPPVAN